MKMPKDSDDTLNDDRVHLHQDEAVHWSAVQAALSAQGYAVVRNFLDPADCDEFQRRYEERERYRKTIAMERYRFGSGEYKYFSYPLPQLLQKLRESIYQQLTGVANEWMSVLGINRRFPAEHAALIAECRSKGQLQPTPLILRYGAGGYNTLHQDLYGDIYFPIQGVVLLSEPGVDFSGGEFVMTQQNPRAQSRAMVLNPRKGDLVLFTTNFRPAKGSHGFHRVHVKHGVSEVHKGERFTLGKIFSRRADMTTVYVHRSLDEGQLGRLLRSKRIAVAGNQRLRIYGTLHCSSGKRMHPKNRVFFTSAKAAIASGFRPCGHCMPEEYKRWKNETL